jgi:DNA-binding CsgD family transcriptional regulator
MLDRFVDTIDEGPAALILRGEPGVGKTTLWRAALDHADRRGLHVLSAVPLEFEAKLSFGCLGDLLGDVVDRLVPNLPGPQGRALEVALGRADQEEGAVTNQRTLSAAFLGAVRALSADRPVLVAVDDLQWIDLPSARILQFALHRLSREPVRLIATSRTGERPSDPLQLRRVLGEDQVRDLPIEGMELDEIDRLLRSRLDVTFPRRVVAELNRLSGGNPFFALEIGRALSRAAPLSPYEPLPIPDDLRELVVDRLNALPETAKEPLLVVAALPQPTMALVTSIVGVHGARQLAPAVDAAVVVVEGDDVRFAHPILGSTFYSLASPDRRRVVHRAIAEVIEDLEERAIHLALSATGPDPEVAAALEEAAGRARSRGAQESAAELLELARRLTPAPLAADNRRRGTLAAQYHFEAGNSGRARTLLERIVKEAPPGPERAEALRLLGTIRWYDSRSESTELLREALAEAGDDSGLRATVERELAWTELMSGNARTAEGHAQAALDVAETLGDPALLADALTAVGFTQAYQAKGHPLDLVERAVGLAQRSERLQLFRHPRLMLGILLKWSDRFDEARIELEAMRTDAVEHGDESTLPYVLYHLSELESWAGDWPGAQRYAEESADLSARTRQEPMRSASLYVKALANARFGHAAAARAEATEGAALAERTENPIRLMQNLHVLGFLELSLGNGAEAARHLAAVESVGTESRMQEPGAVRFHADQIEALLLAGDLGRATSVLAGLEALGHGLCRAWVRATAARCRGLVAAAEGRLEDALHALEEALNHHRALPDPFEEARTLMAVGSTRRRLKQKRPARERLEEARVIFERLGAGLWTERVRNELARVGGRHEGDDELTPTERRVAELVAQGLTSKEAAEALFMSSRTVDANLSRIYQKLGVRSRTEMAARLRDRDPGAK